MQGKVSFGDWRRVERLGQGGNGTVWRCTKAARVEAAVKVLHRVRDRDRITRFRNEIRFLLTQPNRPGIVPLIDHQLPDDPAGLTWYAMPIAEPIRQALGPDPAPATVLEAVRSVAHTLAQLVKKGVSHRDIKPDNLFRLDGAWVIGDFGLVTYPEREPVTRQGRKVGPIDYMAPEMRDKPNEADAELADVYSLAKTLWVLLTNSDLPLPGPHRADDDLCRLTHRLNYDGVEALDLLIEACTSNNPARRWRMSVTARELDSLTSPRPSRPTVTDADTTELERRIALQIEIHRRRDEDRQNFHQRVAHSWDQAEAAVRAAYFSLANEKLPAFGTRHPSQIAAPRCLERTPVIPGYHRSWSGLITSPGDAHVYIELGVMLRVHDTAGKCTMAAIVRVNRHNNGQGNLVNILEGQTESIIGSAHLATIVANLPTVFTNAIPDTLQAVSTALDEERRQSTPPR